MENLRKKERDNIAKILQEKLEELDITKRHLSEKIGVPYSRLCSYMRAEYRPSEDDYNKIAAFFGYTRIDFYDLMNGINDGVYTYDRV